MKHIHVHIEGQVQGVGFRPFVFRLATQMGIAGWVCNDVDGVHIEAEASELKLNNFTTKLRTEAPAISRITRMTIQKGAFKNYSAFEITESSKQGIPNLLITPDIGLCENCRIEIHDPGNRRYQYPFTTCTQCGPRYSILKALPYDRPVTSMNKFALCEQCRQEYQTVRDKRFYSQTNSCPQCAIDTWLLNSSGEKIASGWSEVFPRAISALRQGKIVAVKGIGGYLLLTDACNEEAIKTLRQRKHRPSKPFALLYPDLESLHQDVEISKEEAKEFTTRQSPIVLMRLRRVPLSGLHASLVAPGLNTIGVMQPYTAMFELIAHEFKKPLIATSGNVSGSPVLYKDKEAIHALHTIADLFLINNRDIEIAQDDSVVQFTSDYSKRVVIRRSRGFAPTLLKNAFSDETILAMGADLKSTFTLQANGRIYTSQYLGDLESYESQESFKTALQHLLNLLNAKPERVIIDQHPTYFSSQLGEELANHWVVPVHKVQHHKAHAFAVLAENDLLTSEVPVLCVTWDGTGYGEDRNIWGGEFFEYSDHSLHRIGQLEYVAGWLGDKMAKDTRLSALSFCKNIERSRKNLARKFPQKEWAYYANLLQTKPAWYMSSMGRLFDTVACLTGISNYNSFEGEAAMHLEAKAVWDLDAFPYPVTWKDSSLQTDPLLDLVLTDLENHVPAETIAYKFHAYLADVVYSIVTAKGYHRVAFSGGVFQNALLVDLVTQRLKGYEIFFHRELSPNDENISFGQLAAIEIGHINERYHHREHENLVTA